MAEAARQWKARKQDERLVLPSPGGEGLMRLSEQAQGLTKREFWKQQTIEGAQGELK